MDFVGGQGAVLVVALHVVEVLVAAVLADELKFGPIAGERLDDVAALPAQVHPQHLDGREVVTHLPLLLLGLALVVAVTAFFNHGAKQVSNTQ